MWNSHVRSIAFSLKRNHLHWKRLLNISFTCPIYRNFKFFKQCYINWKNATLMVANFVWKVRCTVCFFNYYYKLEMVSPAFFNVRSFNLINVVLITYYNCHLNAESSFVFVYCRIYERWGAYYFLNSPQLFLKKRIIELCCVKFICIV